jgi:carnitine O-palmitoyltransferase 2
VMGQGVDRHLFALHAWARRAGGGSGVRGLPPLFSDPSFAHFNAIRLSTSTLESPALDGGGFGPGSRACYAVGYGAEDRGAHFHVMCYRDGAGGQRSGASSAAFVEALETSLRDLHDVIRKVKG